MKNHGHHAMTTVISKPTLTELQKPVEKPSYVAARDRSKVTIVLDPRGLALFPGNVQANLVDTEYGKVADVPGFGRVYPEKARLSALGWFPENIKKVVMDRGPVVIRREDVPASLRHLIH